MRAYRFPNATRAKGDSQCLGYCSAITITHFCFTSSFVADHRPQPSLLVGPAGIRRPSQHRNRYSVRRVSHDLIRRCQADPSGKVDAGEGGRGRWQNERRRCATYALFICAAPPKGTCSRLDFDEFNLAFAQGSERAEWD